jgi:hypothetical protein
MERFDHGDPLSVSVAPRVVVRPADVGGLRVVDAMPRLLRLGIGSLIVLREAHDRDGTETASQILVVSCEEQSAA